MASNVLMIDMSKIFASVGAAGSFFFRNDVVVYVRKKNVDLDFLGVAEPFPEPHFLIILEKGHFGEEKSSARCVHFIFQWWEAPGWDSLL